jgi:hypothetical protein
MQKNKMIKLIEDMASAGYEIVKIDKREGIFITRSILWN